MGAILDSVMHDAVPGIIDIRSDAEGINIKNLIKSGLSQPDGVEKNLPTLLLYDNKGLKLFEEITYLDQYYLTGQEIYVLERYADRIAERIPDGAMVVELGSGNLRKVKLLLDALERAEKDISYYALDLMQSELKRTLAQVPTGTYHYVKCFGLWGTYDDGLDWLKTPDNAGKPKTILSLGSSIGNFTREESVGFVKQFADILRPGDTFMIGLDACQDPETVYHAYNDDTGVTHQFTMNGLHHANKLLGREAFRIEDWEAVGEYDQVGERHRAYVVPRRDVEVEGILCKKGERINIEESYKYNQEQAIHLFREASVQEVTYWTNETHSYGLHLLQRASRMFATKPEQYASRPVPSLDEWHDLWDVWDNVTRQMIPDEELLAKPIKLRNACIFYLGHIPTFFDMKLGEATGLEPTEPSYFRKIFERGIDPDVDDPGKCHAHSEIPDNWPELGLILKYQESVRFRVQQLYQSGQAFKDNWTGRALWLGFEHEVMHMETLLYMLVQSDKTRPPKGVVAPDFEQLAAHAKRRAVDNQWFDIPKQTVTIGLEDPDNGDGPVRYFGWDCEKPSYTTKVPAFKAAGRPITNGEYARYLSETKHDGLPASWQFNRSARADSGNPDLDENLNDFIDGKAVRTVHGPVPLKFALDWPVSASYDELSGCAQYMGGRIPTYEETRSIYEYAAVLKKREAISKNAQNMPAVNGHLVNDGVEETPPSKTGPVTNPSDLYVDLSDANVGFKHWHPLPVTQNGNTLAGLGEMGGLWEWTSSELKKRDGFVPMQLYPAYSADFYDGKHYIVQGGSWATHPRFAGRKSVINWYQRNYPYVWAGARLVKDI
ncbi:hypothetical protein DOTSEDRAFT_74272 [Dothistroma septosporum NZE10]|uniref:Histidine-specific methyltransferase SAM-dependent domain-containing protein n=1 Tax=Dothistroma septosporum (strain NZE10 / CBS 128990) TaxID=675120 RepID=N1PEZ8_DOTSN|nr:hypothetical protein DOTSEDRAFT_74272 [Dothistroma septosporum NZE10]